MQTTILRTIVSIHSALSPFHPLLIEGHTRDVRDPAVVASRIVANVRRSWDERNVTKPPILITQGDPITERGISAVTRIVASELGVRRCLICLDEDIDPEHSKLADRHDVVYELKYSQLLDVLNGATFGDSDEHEQDETYHRDQDKMAGDKLTDAIENKIAMKNRKRSTLGKDNLADWYQQYALLQEVTKAAFKRISGEVTVAHATGDIAEFSVTSFYEVGLELGLIDEKNDMVHYSDNGE
mmetsp:Transcript_17851/g.42959  ORF Transcript_17851/g.42959 Transcript_17851/m.42959 type:complete len:241 (+) Transcript_17851:59-781(+)|eukprot:CAMPEP_0181140896 /NCGR_PEP_ID=MMETSP1071-20121207/35540_1 /TAXON_ID=35127 /ORGANISM="Thalassiosira sp., Strain NH16" /LENGTH=240 /DNA_ID=CAMNT_0023227861 /DNA_START=164 /DNA_END=886 /DNA_ORIENTATION=+